MKQSYSSHTEIKDEHKTTNNSHCILTPTTTAAIAILHTIASGNPDQAPHLPACQTIKKLLPQLEAADIICLLPHKKSGSSLTDYKLTKAIQEVSLLQLLKAINEHLDCNEETNENLYNHYRRASSKLGIINYMTRIYLSEIKLSDL